jgi:hypothetical protein
MSSDQFKNVFLSQSGDLISNTDFHVVREKYSYTFREINTSHQLRATIRNGKSTDLGGYPLYLIFADGGPCCFECARKDYKSIAYDMKSEANREQWAIVACDINYESEDLFCAHCDKKIKSAYGNDKSNEEN